MQIKGYIYAFITVILWSGWALITRFSVARHMLSPIDIAFLRFVSAGIIMLPIAIKHCRLINKTNRRDVFIMVLGAGILYFMVMAIGFNLSDAGHSIMTPCLLTIMVAIGSYYMFGEKFSKARIFGYALIIIGVLYKIFIISNGNGVADVLFIIGAVCYAAYTLAAKKHKFGPFVNTAFVQVGSMLIIIPIYIIHQLQSPHGLPIQDSLIQIIYQSIFTSILSLVFYNKAIASIGASKTASFAALLPVIVTFGAIPLLNEIPTTYDYIFVGLMSAGVFFASGVTSKLGKKAKKDAGKGLQLPA